MGYTVLGSKWILSPQGWCVEKQKNRQAFGFEWLTKAKLCWLDDWARASPRSWRTVISMYKKWSMEGQLVMGHGRTRLIDAWEEQRLARLVCSNRWATVARMAVLVKYLHMLRLHSCSGQSAHADQCTPLKASTMSMWASELDHEATEEVGPVWWITFSFISYWWPAVCLTYLGNTWHRDALWKKKSKMLDAV